MILHARDLTHRYGRTTALDACSLSLRSGRITALIGPNGAGKSTFLSLLSRQRRVQSGALIVTDGAGLAFHDLRIGWVPEKSLLFDDLKLSDFIERILGPALGLSRAASRDRGRALAQSLGLHEHYAQRPRAFSHGTQRKASLLIALLERPDLLVLDEPISGLDVHAVDLMLGLLARETREAGMAVVISDHRIDTLSALVDDAVFLYRGRVVGGGSVREVTERHGTLVEAYRALIPA